MQDASNAIIIGFNVRPDPVAEENAKRDGIDLHLYRIIYEAIEDVQAAMKGMLAPKYRELFYGRAECRQVYKISNVGIVMGSYVTSGKIVRNFWFVLYVTVLLLQTIKLLPCVALKMM